MHILFLSADTGGGHRASAEALAKQVRFSKTQKALFYDHSVNEGACYTVELSFIWSDAMRCDAMR